MTLLDEILTKKTARPLRHKQGCGCGKCQCSIHTPKCGCRTCQSTKGINQEFFIGGFARSVRAAMRRGKGILSAKLAMQKGERDENKLTNLIFFARHPELPTSYKLKSHQKALVKEWVHIRNTIVRPMIRKNISPVAPNYGNSSHHFSNANLSCSIVDLKSKAKPTGNYYNRRKTPRRLNSIDSVVLHQMAFNRNNDLNRYLKVKAHYIILQDGKIGQLYPDTHYMHTSNGLNNRSIGIEFAGNFPNERGRYWIPKDRPRWSRNQVTPAQIEAGRCLLADLKKRMPNIKYVFAHRQSSRTRTNDPGPDLWYGVGEYAIKKLGYRPSSRDHSIGTGKPIPVSWTLPKSSR